MAKPFRYWVQKVLPLVYDESLSYYEIICKIVEHLGEIDEAIADISIDPEEVREMVHDEVVDYLDDTQIYDIVMQNLNLYFADVTDYGADKTGNADSTNAFSQAIASGKHIIIVPNGSYIVNNLVVPSNTTILGYGAELIATEMMNGKPNILRNANPNELTDYSAANNIRIEGIGFSAPNLNYCTLIAFGHANDITIRNCRFHHWKGWHAIEFCAVSNGVIDACTFDNYGGSDGIYSECVQLDWMLADQTFPWFGPYNRLDCENIKITNCSFLGLTTIRDNSASQFNNLYSAIGSHSPEPNATRNILISNNYIENFYNGLFFWNLYDSEISNNIIKGCFVGIYLTHYIGGNKICDNILQGVASAGNHPDHWRGIAVYRPENSRISRDNLIDNNNIRYFTHGIAFEGYNSMISNNTCIECYLSGILAGINNSSTQYKYNKISNSTGDATHKALTINISVTADEIISGGLLFEGNIADYCYITVPYTSGSLSFVHDNQFNGGISYGSSGSNNVVMFRNLAGARYNGGARKVDNTTSQELTARTWTDLSDNVHLNRGGVYLIIASAAVTKQNALFSLRARVSGSNHLITNSIMTGNVSSGYNLEVSLLAPMLYSDGDIVLSAWLSDTGNLAEWHIQVVDLAVSPY